MAGGSKRLAAVAVAALLLAGCAGSDEEAAVEREPESEGFAWVGQGEPSNFGSDFNFCNRRLTMASRPQRGIGGDFASDSGSEAYGSMQQRAVRGGGSYSDKRQLWVCMESRGWQLVGAR
jgi:hypothetical protein